MDWNYYDIANRDNDKIKIIQISDLHFDTLRYYHKFIARKITKLNPDLIFITGDSVEATDKILSLNAFLNRLNPRISKYAITGNWEYWGKVDLQKLKATYTANNCTLLINENRHLTINQRTLSIIGIDDYVGGQADFAKAIKNLKPATTNIVLSHCPAHREIIATEKEALKIDLVLSGHTHGGQITLFGYAPFKPQGSGRYLKGWYTDIDPKMYVSKGVGTSMLPISFGARAEIVEIDI